MSIEEDFAFDEVGRIGRMSGSSHGRNGTGLQLRQHHLQLTGLLPQALVATLAVVVLPVAVVLVMVALGLPKPEILLATALGLGLSCAAAAIGTSLWIKRPESVDVGFGELMLWRYFRRKKAEETIEVGAQRLGLVPNGPVAEVEPERRLAVLQDLADALEAKDPYTHGHSRRVERHAYRTAMAMHMAPDDIEDLRLAAALHDVGKIQVPSRILRKPGKLSDQEFALVRRHSEIGASMVESSGDPRVISAIRHHHEAWNGKGYPGKLEGEEIPLFARIIAVADAFDAMTSARPYKPGCSRKEAVEALCAGAGVQFDARVVDAFISTLPTALPAASALLIFAGPAQAARRISGWLKDTTGGGLAGATGAVGMAVLVSTAGMTGGVQHREETPRIQAAAPVEDAVLPALAERDEADVEAAEPKAEVKEKASEPKERKAPRPAAADQKKAPEPKSGGKAGAPAPDVSADDSKGGGGSVTPAQPEPKPEPKPEPQPAPEPKPEPEPEPQAPTDPKPGKGQDCDTEKDDGNGDEIHCGE